MSYKVVRRIYPGPALIAQSAAREMVARLPNFDLSWSLEIQARWMDIWHRLMKTL